MQDVVAQFPTQGEANQSQNDEANEPNNVRG